MKKIFNYKLLTVFTVLLFSSISCTKDFDEINTNNNRPTYAQASPEMLLTNTIENLSDRIHEIFQGEEMGNCWVQHEAKVQYTDEDRYRPRISVINATWTSLYATVGMDAEAMINISKARGADYDNYQAAGIVLKSYAISVLTDLHGDIPYKEAFKARAADGGIVTPVYDTQEEVYYELIRQLNVANNMFNSSKVFNGDILYNGLGTATVAAQVTNWRKFANSLRLRLLLRISDRNSTMATDTMTEMLVTSPASYPIFASNADNAQLTYLGSSPNNNPRNENRKTRDDHRVSKTLIDMMYAMNPKVDWRVTVYANLTEATSDYVGLPNGLESAAAAAYLGNGLAQTSKVGSYFTAATCPGMFMHYAELQFILAEAVQKGLVTLSGTAESYYLAGIAASYNQYATQIVANAKSIFGVTATITQLCNDYINNGGAAWVVGHELELIGKEKWLAMFDEEIESWSSWRESGYPILTPASNAYNATIPQRVYYPSDEYSRNKTNVMKAAADQSLVGNSDLNTLVWWDVDDNF